MPEQADADQQAKNADKVVVRGGTVDTAGNAVYSYQGHPMAYINTSSTIDGVEYWVRTRYIIVDGTTVIFVEMISAAKDSDRDEWTRFENSLNIR